MALRLLALLVPLTVCTGCMGPGVMIVSNIAQATVKTAMDYNEANAPTDDELWADEQVALLRTRADADDGDGEARYQLAQVHQAVEERDAEHWMCEAANVGHPKALLQMGHWYNEDRRDEDLWPYITIRPDDRDAYVYYSLATQRGEPLGAAYRDNAALRMSAREIAAADRDVAGWRPVTCPYVVAVHRAARMRDPAAP